MVRQDGRVPIHFETGGSIVCKRPAELHTTDPREVTCGQCQRRPVWKQAWRDEAKRVRTP